MRSLCDEHLCTSAKWRPDGLGRNRSGADYFIVGIENSAPSLTPDGQREVTVLVLV
jgi:hypothetical protein